MLMVLSVLLKAFNKLSKYSDRERKKRSRVKSSNGRMSNSNKTCPTKRDRELETS